MLRPFTQGREGGNRRSKSALDHSGVTRSVEAAKAEQATTTRHGCRWTFTPVEVRALKLCARSKVADAQNWPWARSALGATATVAPCNRQLSQPYEIYRRAQGGREPLRSDGKDYRADYEHDDLSPNNLKTPDALEANGPLCENLSTGKESQCLVSMAQ
jgi:hypothetical protein